MYKPITLEFFTKTQTYTDEQQTNNPISTLKAYGKVTIYKKKHEQPPGFIFDSMNALTTRLNALAFKSLVWDRGYKTFFMLSYSIHNC